MSVGSDGRLTGVILAGGAATRFGGGAKGLAVVGGRRIIDRVAAALRPATRELLVISPHPDAESWLPDARVLPDERPGLGPLGGIVTALRATGGDVIVLGWDMPFATTAELVPLMNAPHEVLAALWRTAYGVQPLCALYRAPALPMLDAALAGGERRLQEVVLALAPLLIDAAPTAADAFFNVNTGDDLARAEQLMRDPSRQALFTHA